MPPLSVLWTVLLLLLKSGHRDKQCPNDCRLSPETGPCEAAISRFFYNARAGQCQTFTYGGCEGNRNNFKTEKECEKKCPRSRCLSSKATVETAAVNKTTTDQSTPEDNLNTGSSNGPATQSNIANSSVKDVCSLPSAAGYCQESHVNYYYNPTEGQCLEFTYSGCGGNDNRFKTEMDCRTACKHKICSLPSETGWCKAFLPRFFFNTTAGECQEFIFGGCRGNGNNFQSEAECESMCLP